MPSSSALARIRLRHLQCFQAIVRSGTLGGAAQALSITQPAVTKTINELEEILGTRLFERGRRGATLTPEAQVFMLHANASLDALGRAVDSIVEGPREPHLTVGVLPTLAPAFIPAVLRRFEGMRPTARLRVISGRNKTLIDALRNREMDVVIGRLSDPDVMQGVTFEQLFAEPMVIVLRKGHPFATKFARRKVAMSALGEYGFVLPPEATIIRQMADGFMLRHGIVPQGVTVDTLETSLARGLVMHADHAWFTPIGCAQPDLDSGAMVQLPAVITPDEPVGVMLRNDALPTAAVQALVQAAREEAKTRGARKPTRRR
ncbi:LysR substrate-binding domain-containing protein [Piscinibacter terrae]|nr:LysR substrate-binding domain-containing protein [Albitalea terrae]